MAKSVTATPTMASGGLNLPEGRCKTHSQVPISNSSSFQLHLSSFFVSVIEQLFIPHFISRFKQVSLYGHLYFLDLLQCPTPQLLVCAGIMAFYGQLNGEICYEQKQYLVR